MRKNDLNWVDYALVGSGILLLPAFGLGLVLLGIFLYRLGNKWQKHNEDTKKELDEKYRPYEMDYVSDEELEIVK